MARPGAARPDRGVRDTRDLPAGPPGRYRDRPAAPHLVPGPALCAEAGPGRVPDAGPRTAAVAHRSTDHRARPAGEPLVLPTGTAVAAAGDHGRVPRGHDGQPRRVLAGGDPRADRRVHGDDEPALRLP